MATSPTTPNRSAPTHLRGPAAAAAALLAIATLSACGDDDASASAAGTACDNLTMADPYVLATDGEMTASFGELTNDAATPITITAASTSASPRTELHEVVERDGKMVMQLMADGITVAAAHSHTLEPGGDHVMLMGLDEELLPGTSVDITLAVTADEGSDDTADSTTPMVECSLTYAALVKDAPGGEEDYDSGSSAGGSSGAGATPMHEHAEDNDTDHEHAHE
jgi:copper(I)-binding protein